MSKSIEDFFNIDPSDEDEPAIPFTLADRTALMAEASEVYTALTMAEKIDIALPAVSDLAEHNGEMDDISKRAMSSFEDLMTLGGNVQDLHAGKIYEVASTMLKTAMDAKNAKIDKKLRIIELQLKKARLDQIENPDGNRPTQGAEFDRNELMKHIVSSSKPHEE